MNGQALKPTKSANGDVAIAKVAVDTSKASSSTFNSLAATQPVAEGLITVDGHVLTATKLANGDVAVANTTIDTRRTSETSFASISGYAVPSNVSVDECYASWDKYWKAEEAAASYSRSVQAAVEEGRTPTATRKSTDVKTWSANKATTYTLVTSKPHTVKQQK